MVQLGRHLEALIGIRCGYFNSVNCNKYQSGKQFLRAHCDNEELFYDHKTWESKDAIIVSSSFGASRLMRFQHVFDDGIEMSQILHDKDIIVMSGQCQKNFRHSIPAASSIGSRINLTFRRILSHQPGCPLASN